MWFRCLRMSEKYTTWTVEFKRKPEVSTGIAALPIGWCRSCRQCNYGFRTGRELICPLPLPAVGSGGRHLNRGLRSPRRH